MMRALQCSFSARGEALSDLAKVDFLPSVREAMQALQKGSILKEYVAYHAQGAWTC